MKKIGVLDIQGSVDEHFRALERCGAEVVRVKRVSDLQGLAGLVLPGGESTTMSRLMKSYGLDEAILSRVSEGMGIFGTCAGAILMAKKISGDKNVNGLNVMDIVVERNAYGRQLDSFECELEFKDIGVVPAVFIRAPKIISVGADVEILAKHGDEIVAASKGRLMAMTFHPEMTEDLRVVRWWVGRV